MRNHIGIIDLETTCRGPDGEPGAEHYQNEVLLYGICIEDALGIDYGAYYGPDKREFKRLLDSCSHIVGHNLPFDLCYLLREFPGRHTPDWRTSTFWDTMFAEYKLTGHMTRTIGLEALCKERGIEDYKKKLDLSEELKKHGGKMEDIDQKVLCEYLKDDVQKTREVYHRQINSPEAKWAGKLFHDHVICLAEMKLNGMVLDVPFLERFLTLSLTAQFKMEKTITKAVYDALRYTGVSESDELRHRKKITPMSARSLSMLFTGFPTEVKCTKKASWLPPTFPLLSYDQINEIWGEEYEPSHLGYSMASGIMDKIETILERDLLSSASTSPEAALCRGIMEYRKVSKLTSSFLLPFKSDIWKQDEALKKALPSSKVDMYLAPESIYPDINHCIAVTGRLTSSNPNGQNMPPAAKQCFKSRFKGGMIVEIDKKQLEIVALAHLTKDPTLIADLRKGADIHYEVGKTVFKWKSPSDMDKETRRIVKSIVFGLCYGGGAKTLSEQSGAKVSVVNDVIKAFYDRYDTISTYHENLKEEVEGCATPAGIEEGEQKYQSHILSQGVIYSFVEKRVPRFVKVRTGRKFGFKPTEIKNYPVQGFAGYSIMMRTLYNLWSLIKDDPKTKLIMTVHDSIVIDLGDATPTRIEELKENVKLACTTTALSLSLPTDLNTEIEYNTHWSKK
jgi:DNA polymerase I-like protein with 3'-5' exonuclease and polymerase domains